MFTLLISLAVAPAGFAAIAYGLSKLATLTGASTVYVYDDTIEDAS